VCWWKWRGTAQILDRRIRSEDRYNLRVYTIEYIFYSIFRFLLHQLRRDNHRLHGRTSQHQSIHRSEFTGCPIIRPTLRSGHYFLVDPHVPGDLFATKRSHRVLCNQYQCRKDARCADADVGQPTRRSADFWRGQPILLQLAGGQVLRGGLERVECPRRQGGFKEKSIPHHE